LGAGGAFACEQRDRLGLLREKAGGIEKRRKVSAAASLDVGERRDLAR
jgi:hypothetical protein